MRLISNNQITIVDPPVKLLNEEIWVSIIGFEKYYLISNMARVFTLGRFFTRKNGLLHTSPQKILKPYFPKDAYCTITMGVEGVRYYYQLHYLVAMHFVPNPNNYNFINHEDGNKHNCKASNLSWCTPSQNTNHAYANNLVVSKKLENHPMVKLTLKQVLEIKNLFNNGVSNTTIARLYNVTRSNIYHIRAGKTWKDEIINNGHHQ